MIMNSSELEPQPLEGAREPADEVSTVPTSTRTRRLRKVEVEITSECIVGRKSSGAACVHCSLKAGTGLASYLSLKEIRAILRDARYLGASVLVLTGGEPSQHPDFPRALECARALGLKTRVYTTGVTDAWGEHRIEDVATLIDQVYLSVEGIGETHDRVLGWPGAFAHTTKFIGRLQKLGMRWAAHFTPMRPNYLDLESVARTVHDLGADALKLIDFIPQGRGWDNRASLGLDDRQYYDLFSVVRGLQDELRAPDGSAFVRFHDETYTKRLSEETLLGDVLGGGCTSGRESCAVLSDGTVIPCLGFRLELSGERPRRIHVAGNVRTHPLREIWSESEVLLRFADSQAEDVNPMCHGCSMLDECLGCCS